ncbi:MAG: hypothetical protein QXO21_03065 [Candidatus Anstonellales archaeon]
MKYEEILRKLNVYFIFPQELIWIDKGIKNVLRKGFQGDESEIERLCRFMGLEYLIVKESPYFGPSRGKVVYLSKSMKVNKEAHKAYVKRDNKKVGELLSYPNCCIQAHLLGRNAIDTEYDFSELSFYTNMLHNMETRLKDSTDFERWSLLRKKG